MAKRSVYVPRAGEAGIQTSGGDAGLVPTADVIWTSGLIIFTDPPTIIYT